MERSPPSVSTSTKADSAATNPNPIAMDKTALRSLRVALAAIGRDYHQSACPEALVSAITAAGLPASTLDGIYTGREGRALHKITDAIGLVHTWYRLESGRYEVIAYLSI